MRNASDLREGESSGLVVLEPACLSNDLSTGAGILKFKEMISCLDKLDFVQSVNLVYSFDSRGVFINRHSEHGGSVSFKGPQGLCVPQYSNQLTFRRGRFTREQAVDLFHWLALKCLAPEIPTCRFIVFTDAKQGSMVQLKESIEKVTSLGTVALVQDLFCLHVGGYAGDVTPVDLGLTLRSDHLPVEDRLELLRLLLAKRLRFNMDAYRDIGLSFLGPKQ